MRKQIFIISLFFLFHSCKSQTSIKKDFDLMKKEVSKASLRKYAFYECLNSSVDSLSNKLNDSSADNLYYRLYGFDPVSNPKQRPYIDSLINFAKKWGKKDYPNYDHPATKMHVTNCLNMYESYDLEELIEKIFNEAVDKKVIENSNESIFKEFEKDPAMRYKYYDLYKLEKE